MTTNTFDSIRFMEIYKDSRHKNLLIEDKVHNLLDDILINRPSANIRINAFACSRLLCDSMSFNNENNSLIIDYSDALQDCIFVANLINWVNTIKPNDFEYKNLQYICDYEDEILIKNMRKIIMRNYILFDDWWEDFVKLRKELEELLEELLFKSYSD